MITNRRLICVSICAMLSSMAVNAEEIRWYGGGSIGTAHMSPDITAAEWDARFADLGLATSSTMSDDDVGFKLFYGYRAHRHLSLEGSYFNFGEPLSFSTRLQGVISPPFKSDVKMRGWAFDALGMMPIDNRFSLFGRAGFYRVQSQVNSDLINDVDREINPKLGMGVDYSLTTTLSARAEFEYYKNMGNAETTGEGNINYWSAGLIYDF